MKRFVFWLVRLGIRPFMSSGVPLWLQRYWSRLVSMALIGPRHANQTSDLVAGIETLRIEPANRQSGRGVLFLHGGGYVSCDASSHEKLAAWVGHAAQARVWLPEYRLAPEYPYPTAIHDALAVYETLLDAGQDPEQLVIAGDSAGGGLTLATAIAIRDSGLPLPAALVLYSPWADLSLSGNSIRTHASRDAMIKLSWIRWCADQYRGAVPANDPGCSPLFADLSGLPPILVHVGTEEILLSDSERLVERLKSAGVEVEFKRFEGVGHVFQYHTAVLQEADESIRQTGAFIERQLRQPFQQKPRLAGE